MFRQDASGSVPCASLKAGGSTGYIKSIDLVTRLRATFRGQRFRGFSSQPDSWRIDMGKTTDNLKAAFAGESQARNKYIAYGRKAELEGMPNVAKLFRAAADAEEVHAIRHWKALGMVRDTLQNLEDGLAGETYEIVDMYPEFLAQAEKEQEITATYAFKGALEAEKIHQKLYAAAIEAVKAGARDIEAFRVYTCEVCGYTHVGEPIEKCPICSVPWTKFHEVL